MKTFFALTVLVLLGSLASQTSAQRIDLKEDCFCPAVFLPVCGTNGKTYGNSCEMYCSGDRTKILHDGPCGVKG